MFLFRKNRTTHLDPVMDDEQIALMFARRDAAYKEVDDAKAALIAVGGNPDDVLDKRSPDC